MGQVKYAHRHLVTSARGFPPEIAQLRSGLNRKMTYLDAADLVTRDLTDSYIFVLFASLFLVLSYNVRVCAN